MSISDYGAQQWAGIMVGIGAVPATFYIALVTDEPGDGWDGTVLDTLEPTDPIYGRQPVASGTGWTLSDGGFVINAVDIAFPVPLADWGQITHFAVTDAIVGGNLWAYGRLLDPMYIPAGYPPLLGVGSVYLGLSNQLASIAE